MRRANQLADLVSAALDDLWTYCGQPQLGQVNYKVAELAVHAPRSAHMVTYEMTAPGRASSDHQGVHDRPEGDPLAVLEGEGEVLLPGSLLPNAYSYRTSIL
jgi:hypothetical protein